MPAPHLSTYWASQKKLFFENAKVMKPFNHYAAASRVTTVYAVYNGYFLFITLSVRSR